MVTYNTYVTLIYRYVGLRSTTSFTCMVVIYRGNIEKEGHKGVVGIVGVDVSINTVQSLLYRTQHECSTEENRFT